MNDLENIYCLNFNPTTEEIFHHLCFVHATLLKHNIKHWLMYGTLLGCVRDKNVIPYDYDFDFGIMIDDYDKILNIDLTNTDYQIKSVTGTYYSKASKFKTPETFWRISLGVYYKENKVGDLYIYTNCEDGYTRRYSKKDKLLFWPKSTFPTVLIENLETGFIRDVELPIPNHAVLLVEYFYGPMWVTPIRAFSQDGTESHPYYDFYGGYIYSSLNELIKKTVEAFEKDGKKIQLNKPSLKVEDVEYLFPLDQFDWIKENEGLDFKFKAKKNKK